MKKWVKDLKVYRARHGGVLVPAIRVCGKWLERCEFLPGDKVLLVATQGRIVIKSTLNPVRGREEEGVLDARLNMRRRFLKVFIVYHRRKKVPAIKVSGNWLLEFGFSPGDDVVLAAGAGVIVVGKKR